MAYDYEVANLSCCLKELIFWNFRASDKVAIVDEYHKLNATKRSVFLYEVKNHKVTILAKPNFFTSVEMADRYSGPTRRALYYRDFFQFVVRRERIDSQLIFAVDVDDKPIQTESCPVLVFQKPQHDRGVLLPDIDLLYYHFHISRKYSDSRAFLEKENRAVFYGATTGGTITEEVVRELRLQRLRSAVFFRDSRDVDFRLPRIVQCRDDAARELVRNLNVGGREASWDEQFKNKFIISMDGNGATCSRVAVSLASQSVLLKYDSPHLLYYFNCLVPWQHYVPISSDQDVLNIIEYERRNPGDLAFIAHQGSVFARTMLSRAAVTNYMALLIRRICALIGQEKSNSPLEQQSPSLHDLDDYSDFVVVVNVEGKGDFWGFPFSYAGDPGSNLPLNGFQIFLDGDLPADQLEYCCVSSIGSRSAWRKSGEYCGFSGPSEVLTGFAVRLIGEAASKWSASYQAISVGGIACNEARDGELSQSNGRNRVEAIALSISPRGHRSRNEI